MTVSTVGVDDAATPDKYLHTEQRTISGTAREDQYVQLGESAYPTYNAIGANVSLATVNDHLIQVMGDGTNYTRIKRISFIVRDHPAAANAAILGLYRLSTAGTGGSAVTPNGYDSADTYGGGAMTLPSSKGTEGALLHSFVIPLPTAPDDARYVYWEVLPDTKPMIVGTSTANGLAIKSLWAVASCSLEINVEFITTSYL